MRTSLTVLVAGLLVLATSVIAGCGLKGDLYLPEDEAATAPDESGGDQDDNERPDSPSD